MEGSQKETARKTGYRVGATPRPPHGSVMRPIVLRLRVFCEARADATVPQHPGLPEGHQKEVSARQGGILGGAVKCPDPLASPGAVRLDMVNESMSEVSFFDLR